MSKLYCKPVHRVVVCGFILMVATTLSCGSKAPSGKPSKQRTTSSANNPENGKPANILKPGVLFPAPQFNLTDEKEESFTSQELVGRVWIANFMFTHCQATCPRQAERLAQIQRRTASWPNGHRLRFLSITVDPERDTSARLLEYSREHQADSSRWKFLTGTRDDLWRLSKEGFKLPVAGNALESTNPITHSSRFMLVDAQARVRGVYESLIEEEVSKMLGDMQLLLSEPILDAPDPMVIGVPPDVFDPIWLDSRRGRQLATADSIEAYHDFQFEDQVQRSGIQFVNRPVADAAKDFKLNHYDHGNGISAADVDGDGLIDLYFTCQRGANQLWRNLGDGRFEDITDAAGVGLGDRVSVSASFADTDNDGDPDLFVTTTRHGNAFFVNDGKGNFADQTANAGLEYIGHSSSADFFDYDRDGLLDLLVTNVGKFTTDKIGYSGDPAKQEFPYYVGTETSFGGHLISSLSERSILYHNDGNNQFHDASAETGFKNLGWSGDATPLDANGDGWIDLYVLNMQGNDAYFENVEGKRFEERSREKFSVSMWGGMGVKSFDYNNDGRLDLYVTNMHADMWEMPKNILGEVDEKKRVSEGALPPASYLQGRRTDKNVFGSGLFVGQEGGGYFEMATDVNADNYWPWGPSVADLNADGYQDLFIASCMNFPYRYHVNSVLLNEGGRMFRDVEFILGVEPRRESQTATRWFEVDTSGADAKHRLSKGRSGKVEVWGAVGTRSAVIFDLDRDGDLDIVTNDLNKLPMVLVSNLSERNPALRYLSVQLRGSKSNRDGLGATVTVTMGNRVLSQVHDGQSGYLSQSSLPLYFGLGNAEVIDKVAIRWPDGAQQVIEGPVAVNQRLIVDEQPAP